VAARDALKPVLMGQSRESGLDDTLNEPAPVAMDQQLLRARAGQSAALGALVQAHQRQVYSLALRMLGTRDLAEDLMQEVFMQMNDNLKSIRSSEHLAFWLRKVTTHRAIDQLRRRSRITMTSLDEDAQLFGIVDEADPLLQRQLRLLLLELNPPARAVVLLRYQEDLDPMDIARTLDMSINTVKSHLKRSLETLRNRLTGPADTRREDNST
jgi:RNA polymerase sigma-70 factor (ECF subfamily)